MGTTTATTRGDLEERVMQAEEKLAALQAEIASLEKRAQEAIEADKAAYSERHREWVNDGKVGPRPTLEVHRLRTVQRRERELRTEIPEANAELHEAKAARIANKFAPIMEALSSEREARDELVARREKELNEIQRRIWDLEGKEEGA